MQQIKDLFNNLRIVHNPKSRKTERGELVVEFAEKINADRTGKYKPLEVSYYAYMLSAYSVPQLYELLKKCQEGDNFGALFWWYVKNMPANEEKGNARRRKKMARSES